MSLEENKRLADSFHLEVMEKLNLALADKIFTPDCVFHIAPLDARWSVRGPETAKRLACSAREGYKDAYKFVHSDHVAQGNGVAYRWKVLSTATKEQPILSEGVDYIVIDNGMIAAVWSSSGDPLSPTARSDGWQY